MFCKGGSNPVSKWLSCHHQPCVLSVGGGGGCPALCLSDCHITLIMCFVREVPALCLSDCHITLIVCFVREVPALCLSDCHITLIMCFVREVPALCLSDCYVTTNPVSCQGGGGGGSSPVSKSLSCHHQPCVLSLWTEHRTLALNITKLYF